MSIDNVADVSRRVQYTAANGQTEFPYTFPIFDQDDLVVQVDGSTQTITTDYTVDGVEEDDGGNVTFVVAMSGGEIITIYSDTAIQRLSDFSQNGPNLSTVMNDELDRMTIVDQENREAVRRAIRFPMSSAMSATDTELSPISNWEDRYLYINSDGELEPAANLETTTLTRSVITGLIFPRTAAEVAAGVTPSDYNVPSHEQTGLVLSSRYGPVGDGSVDDTTVLQAWLDVVQESECTGVLEEGTYKITAPLEIATSCGITGKGIRASIIHAWDCNAFEISDRFVIIEHMQLVNYTAVGVVDAKTDTGIAVLGVAGVPITTTHHKHLYIRGFDRSVNWDYVTDGALVSVETINCNYGLRMFGQCLNCVVDKCKLVVNTGTASILTVKDGATQGEGLAVTSTLLASGTYGVSSDGFLVMSFANCITDLVQDRAFNLSGVAAFSYTGGWVYADDYAFYFAAQGSPFENAATINTRMEVAVANGIGVFWGANNRGLTVNGGSCFASASGTGRPIYIDGDHASVDNIYLSNSSGNTAIYVNNSTARIGDNITGDKSTTYNVSPVPTKASAATVTLDATTLLHSTHIISGTTTITSVTATGFAGKLVTLVFQDILTFTDGSNLKLAGDFVTSADDTITLSCTGTNWFEVCRSAN